MRRKQIDALLKRLAVATAQRDRDERFLEIATADLQEWNDAQAIVQSVAEAVQQQAHAQIASVVSRCLLAVFDEPYHFKIQFERKRNRTEARLLFDRDGREIDPMTASGGGVIDVASFALRLACLMLSRPPRRRLLVLDEPFKFVSRDLRPRIKLLLETLSREMGLQIIMVTHIEELQTGEIIEL